ncbi:MAG: MiaB/RimO family radical SAM methylthiotransferase [Sphingopyxis sp.]|nr:MiaB/RimO family radical SAM methylthiotransferase [Sphingopyxis sp.]
MIGPEVINFGCRLNIAEGEAVRRAAAGIGPATIINSCAVTHAAEREAARAIRRAARTHPGRPIYVSGCAAETARDRLAAMPEVSAVIANSDKMRSEAWVRPGTSMGAPLMERKDAFAPVVSGRDHARAFVAIQTGCDHRCTFCIIPFGRGNSRSAPAADVVAAIEQAVERGQQEVVLTGVDLTSYGHDLPGTPTLGALVERILIAVPALPRLRLSSLDSVEIDPLLFELLTGEARMMPHAHLSLQAGDDMILKRMKRRHARADAVRLVERLKAKRDIAIGADIIAGFPTEDAAMAANTLALVDDCQIAFGHIFPYSPRSGTPAARMPQVDPAVARTRAAALRAACARQLAEVRANMIGTRQTMLVENDGLNGHAENFTRLRLGQPATPGALIATRVLDGYGAARALEREIA